MTKGQDPGVGSRGYLLENFAANLHSKSRTIGPNLSTKPFSLNTAICRNGYIGIFRAMLLHALSDTLAAVRCSSSSFVGF
jgi:hypothetical protein